MKKMIHQTRSAGLLTGLTLALCLSAGITHAQITNLTISIPTNIPPSLVQAEMLQSARAIALAQVQRASLVQLETANPALTNLDAGSVNAARQIMATTIRATGNINKLNQIIVAMPAPVTQTTTNIP